MLFTRSNSNQPKVMKLRVKCSGQSRQIDFGEPSADTSSLTLRELKATVSESFLLQNRNVDLSLNKKDILTGDEVPIADLGIVHGDLIHVITGDGPENIPAIHQQPRPQPIASHSQSQGSSVVVEVDRNQNKPTDERVPSQTPITTSDHPSLASAAHSSHSSMEDDHVSGRQSSENIQRSMLEPLVIRESTASQVPPLLQELYSSSDITCPNDALFILLHTLMLESGFSLPGDVDQTRLPAGWKRSGFYMCCYEYVLTPDTVLDCSLMAVTTGKSMAVHGLSKTVGNFKTDHLQLKAENYVRDLSQESAAAAFRSLDRLSTMFKDTIGLVLLNYLATSAGFRETQGLLSLPCEVRMRLMCFLDAKSVCTLGQTCQQWRSIYKDNTVWRRLYIQSFERPDDSSLSRNWYEMFKERYQLYLEEQERRRRFMMQGLEEDFNTDPWNPFRPPFHPLHPLPPPPRFLGGDHDLDPMFDHRPNVMNGRGGGLRGPPNTFLAHGHGQGRIGRGRGNLTGSPFFDDIGGSFL